MPPGIPAILYVRIGDRVNAKVRYDNVAISLHWLTVLLIITMYGLGWYMVDIPRGTPERSFYFALHKSFGLTTAMVIVLRLVWRLVHRPPPLPDTLRRWQRMTATAVHHLLYLFLILQPLSGYVSSSFSGYKTRWWGVPLPDWGWKNQVLNEAFTEIHVVCSVVLLILIVLHVCGALAHLYMRHDNVLGRMVPWLAAAATDADSKRG